MEGVLPWLVRAGTRDFCPALTAVVSPVKNSIFTFSLFQSPSSRNLGKQSCRIACLCVLADSLPSFRQTDQPSGGVQPSFRLSQGQQNCSTFVDTHQSRGNVQHSFLLLIIYIYYVFFYHGICCWILCISVIEMKGDGWAIYFHV